jgi:hypothetical protein
MQPDGDFLGAMLARQSQRDSKHVRREIMPTASAGMALSHQYEAYRLT